jgi:hypothetical protein
MVGRDRVEPHGSQFLLMILLMLLIPRAIGVSRKDQEQDHDQEQE